MDYANLVGLEEEYWLIGETSNGTGLQNPSALLMVVSIYLTRLYIIIDGCRYPAITF